MTTPSTLRHLSVLLALVVGPALAASCASTAPGAETGAEVSVRVENDLIPPTVVTVHAAEGTTGGARRLLGTVEPSRTAVLSLTPIAAAGQYVFVARTTAGRQIASNPVTVSEGDTVVWRLSSNIATVQ